MPVDGPSYLVGRTDKKVLTMFLSSTNYCYALYLLATMVEEERIKETMYLRVSTLYTNTPPQFHMAQPNGIGKLGDSGREETRR